jgi:peptidoglycan/xylan/chitin deacetylase (PgdA/CDA1 family)
VSRSRVGVAAALTAAGVGAAGVGAAYRRQMSPTSQAVGPFPAAARGDSGRTLALTFDDGPNEPFTSEVAGLLESRGVRGTFFQVGQCVERHPGLGRDLAEAGHVIGNHSHRHAFHRGWTEPALHEEIGTAQEVLTAELGARPLLYRPPWLIRTAATFRVLDELGLSPVSGHFCHPLEPLQPDAARMARWAADRVARPGRIVIFHDGFDNRGGDRRQTVEALAILLDRWLEEGYSFVTVDRLLGLRAYS